MQQNFNWPTKAFQIPVAHLLVGLVVCLSSKPAAAHFVWLTRISVDGDVTASIIGLSESADGDGSDLIEGGKFSHSHAVTADGRRIDLQPGKQGESQSWRVSHPSPECLVSTQYTYGVFNRGESYSLLTYYAANGPETNSRVWLDDRTRQSQRLVIVPSVKGEQLHLQILWEQKACADSEVVIVGPEATIEAESDEQGLVSLAHQGPGLYEIRARKVIEQAGTFDGQSFSKELHYATLTWTENPTSTGANSDTDRVRLEPTQALATLPDLPEAVTSFGAAHVDGALYVFGGHRGRAHEYVAGDQANILQRLTLSQSDSWMALSEALGAQGLALVTDGDFLYRLGGMQARNREGEDHDLWSLDNFERFDRELECWLALPDLPEPRSSFDAVYSDGKIYVVGGWNLAGPNRTWHPNAWKIDLSELNQGWQPIAPPQRNRRAFALGSFAGKIAMIGGMLETGGPTTSVEIYDIQRDLWTTGPSLPGEGMNGFGTAAVGTESGIYATTMEGQLWRLGSDFEGWSLEAKLSGARFFHRMLAVGDKQLVLIGGADMEVGKFADLEVVPLEPGSTN